MTTTPTIGVLALQGAFREHLQLLESMGIPTLRVRNPQDLAKIQGLIIPGGESTTIGKLLELHHLMEPLRDAIANDLAVYGTCAGMILLSEKAVHKDGSEAVQPLIGAMKMTVMRNAFGRQIDSFETPLAVAGISEPMNAVFVRAPQVIAHDEQQVTVLAQTNGKIVVCRQGRLLASAFHPELAGDSRLHKLFVNMIG